MAAPTGGVWGQPNVASSSRFQAEPKWLGGPESLANISKQCKTYKTITRRHFQAEPEFCARTARADVSIPRPPIARYLDFLRSLLSDRERFFEEVVEGSALRDKLRYAVVTIVVLAGLFGLVAGSYSGPAQAVSAAIKLPFLFFATFAICFPAFFVVQVLVGSRLRLEQVAVLVFGALALTSVLLAAFVPITAFFLVSGANYYFQHLLNIAIAGVAGIFGMYALHEGLRLVCEKRGVYTRKALTIMRAWALLLAFVGVQLAWSLRPFLGDRNQPFRV